MYHDVSNIIVFHPTKIAQLVPFFYKSHFVIEILNLSSHVVLILENFLLLVADFCIILCKNVFFFKFQNNIFKYVSVVRVLYVIDRWLFLKYK